MIYDKNILKYIAEKGCTVDERLGPLFSPSTAADDREAVDYKLESWRNTIAGEDRELFERRLTFGGIESFQLPHLLGAVKLVDPEELPQWVRSLEELLDEYAPVYTVYPGDTPIAFEDVLLPFVCTARRRLDSMYSSAYSLLCPEVLDSFCRNLLGQLSQLFTKILDIEFSAYRGSRQSAFMRLLGRISAGSDSRVIYDEFVQFVFDEGMRDILFEYPVLCRLIATTIDFWVESTGEFLVRLGEDLQRIEAVYCGGKKAGRVAEVWPGVSDMHFRGRTAIILRFSDGLKLVYKPRDFGLEEAYYALLDWLNRKESPFDFRVLKVINRGSHGWTEFVEHLPCSDETELQSYYGRAGALLALTYFLEGNDFHFENIIASGPYPVLVDMETLLHPRIDEFYDIKGCSGARILAERKLSHSVLHTWLLPWLYFVQDGCAYDISGFGSAPGAAEPIHILQWINTNTDDMRQEQVASEGCKMQNYPFLNASKHSIFDYSEHIIEGFSRFYSFILDKRTELLSSSGPLEGFRGRKSRFLFRATRSYAQLLSMLLHPRYLRDEVNRFIALDTMSSYMSSYGDNHPFWPLLQEELSAMDDMDIPYFQVYCDSSHIEVGDKRLLDNCFPYCGLEAVKKRLAGLSRADMEQQIRLIGASLGSKLANDKLHDVSVSFSDEPDNSKAEEIRLSEVEAYIRELAAEYDRNAIRGSDGSAVWLGPGIDPNGRYFRVKASDCGLFDGSGGIALFLAAVEKVLNTAAFHELTLAALKSFECLGSQLCERGQDSAAIASWAYCLTYTGRLLNRRDLLELAYNASDMLTAGSIQNTPAAGILNGLAGILLSLLSLYKAGGGAHILDKAAACGLELGARLNTPDIQKNTDPVYGFSGIAYALSRLYRATGEKSFIDTAVAYMSREQIVQIRDWHKCIALMRLVSEEEAFSQWLEPVRLLVESPAFLGTDQLLLGNMGRAELLLEASLISGRQDLSLAAMRQAKMTVARASREGGFTLLPAVDKGSFVPGLLMGSAGIGFELLRLFYPHNLPSVILQD